MGQGGFSDVKSLLNRECVCDFFELLSQVKAGLLALRQKLTIGDIRDFTVFTGAVIDAVAFKRISGYIEYAKKSPKMEILGGGGYDNSYVLSRLSLAQRYFNRYLLF